LACFVKKKKNIFFYQNVLFFRQVRENDLVMPEQARAVAKELGLPYYETSVLTYFGVNQVIKITGA
jgi:Rho-related BTB domain-containing protein 1/2